MKLFLRVLSYVFTALLACAVTLAVMLQWTPPTTKIDQLESLIESCFIGEYSQSEIEDAAAEAMVDALGDRWSYYLNADAFLANQEQVENAYVGIGITISPAEDGSGFTVIAVQPSGSAHQAGICVGDVIVGAEGQNAADLDAVGLRNIVRGPEGTTVQLEILRDGEILPFVLTRTRILVEMVTSRMLEDGIGLITIANFDSRCADDSIAAIEALREQGASALIFDVRNNPGGYASELVKLLDYLLPEGPLFRSVDYAGVETIDQSDADFLDLPMAVLCNGESYSAAEFFAAALQEYGAGIVVGTPTCGKGYFQYTFRLSDGSGVGLSVGKYYTPKGVSLAGVGIQPDIITELSAEESRQLSLGTLVPERDPQLIAAVEALTSEASE